MRKAQAYATDGLCPHYYKWKSGHDRPNSSRHRQWTSFPCPTPLCGMSHCSAYSSIGWYIPLYGMSHCAAYPICGHAVGHAMVLFPVEWRAANVHTASTSAKGAVCSRGLPRESPTSKSHSGGLFVMDERWLGGPRKLTGWQKTQRE